MRHHTLPRIIDAVARAGSIRKAAEQLALTHTALNRRILAFEAELGAPVFERRPRGVRLSPAGELVIHHFRSQMADMERVRSQIADLSGERRGHVGIACSQALLPGFLPRQIAAYRALHPAVTFGVELRDRDVAEQALVEHAADIALVFEPVRVAEVQTLLTVPQPVCAVMAADHPLAGDGPVRLRDCLLWPVAVPTPLYGVRHILDAALARSSVRLSPAVESSSFEFLRAHVQAERLITFQIPIGLSEGDDGLCVRPLDARDARPGLLHVCQLRGRTLPVAAARFCDQIVKALAA
ncbi:MAG: LysR family transcriptional regulator [Rubrimonas sp.]|uniref:LysR family transcriptional regulator n=1 Tax=Rubrimonas sp. TaxID=2036015 RepID=UPI002FDCA9F4